MTSPPAAAAPRDEDELEARLSEPTPSAIDALRRVAGDIIVLGAGGKMGPSIARMLRRAADALGPSGVARRVIAVSRFSSHSAEERLRREGVETVRANLADRAAVARLPDAACVFYLAGQKFGTTGAPWETWVANAVVPSIVAERYRTARIVAFSTGNVYPLVPVAGGGARETDAPQPVGEYAWSCLARERIFEHYARTDHTPVALIRLNYAVDLRYGVLVDVARKVAAGQPVDVTMGFANVIWQRDAAAIAIEALPHAAVPPFLLNVTGAEVVSVRRAAERLGELLGRPAVIVGQEAPDALLSDTTRLRATSREPLLPLDVLMTWVAEWIRRGGPLLDRPTHFEARDGRF